MSTVKPILPERLPRRVEDLRDSLVIRSGTFFLLTDRDGSVPAGNASGLGLYHDDTRYLSAWEFQIDGADALPLLSIADLGFAMEQVFVAPELVAEDGSLIPAAGIQIRRQRVLDARLAESYQFSNYADATATLNITFRFESDFADIFEVRGLPRDARGTVAIPRTQANGILLRYQGLDGKGRQTRIRFRPLPDEITSSTASFRIRVPGRTTSRMTVVVLADAIAGNVSVRQSTRELTAARHFWRSAGTKLVTNHELTNAIMDRSLDDIHMLRSAMSGEPYIAAGTPWFNTLFGRDAIMTALMLLPYSPEIARGTLRVLADVQGSTFNDARDEQPGKIVHEIRTCETARTGEVPFERYYGSIDATALFILLAGEYFRWTEDFSLMQELLPALNAALHWLEATADMDGDGFVEYQKKTPHGLDNQGWKDSHDSIVDESGGLLQTPIALVEVQGYVYAALRALGDVLAALGDRTASTRLRTRALLLRQHINGSFWLDKGCYGLALDGDKQLSTVMASNGGHLLWSGVPTPPQASMQAQHLFRDDMFTGWGIRTLSSRARRYNPLGYHLGTIWPHDNAIIVAGLQRYGLGIAAQRLTDTLCEAAANFPSFRLPELFSGAHRLAHHAPVPYPVACRPQAWAAAAVPFAVTSLLGLRPQASTKSLVLVRPRLPSNVDALRVRDLHIGDSSVDFDVLREGRRITVQKLGRGGIKVTVTKSLSARSDPS